MLAMFFKRLCKSTFLIFSSMLIVVEGARPMPEISGGISRETPQALVRRGGSPPAPQYPASAFRGNQQQCLTETPIVYFQGSLKKESSKSSISQAVLIV
jgi:hypothetical protein